mgnify:CR=1 FL=1|tara:strand:- start:1104 stop:1313 length:210 start_codon:yes stop_codon:yes gene_type:complete
MSKEYQTDKTATNEVKVETRKKMTTESKDVLRKKLKDALDENMELRDKVADQGIVIGLLSREVRNLGGQ